VIGGIEMPKINGKELVEDIRAGMSPKEISEKHEIPENALRSVIEKLKEAKRISPSEAARFLTIPILWRCRVCNSPQIKEGDVCPDCGALRSKPIVEEVEEEPRYAPWKSFVWMAGFGVLVIAALIAYVVTRPVLPDDVRAEIVEIFTNHIRPLLSTTNDRWVVISGEEVSIEQVEKGEATREFFKEHRTSEIYCMKLRYVGKRGIIYDASRIGMTPELMNKQNFNLLTALNDCRVEYDKPTSMIVPAIAMKMPSGLVIALVSEKMGMDDGVVYPDGWHEMCPFKCH
jgi:rubredoxin